MAPRWRRSSCALAWSSTSGCAPQTTPSLASQMRFRAFELQYQLCVTAATMLRRAAKHSKRGRGTDPPQHYDICSIMTLLFSPPRPQVFKTIGIPAVKLLFVPGLVEAFFDGGIAVALFGMTPLFGFALGFILKAIGPALVIQLMFELQQKRLGTERSECLLCLAFTATWWLHRLC